MARTHTFRKKINAKPKCGTNKYTHAQRQQKKGKIALLNSIFIVTSGTDIELCVEWFYGRLLMSFFSLSLTHNFFLPLLLFLDNNYFFLFYSFFPLVNVLVLLLYVNRKLTGENQRKRFYGWEIRTSVGKQRGKKMKYTCTNNRKLILTEDTNNSKSNNNNNNKKKSADLTSRLATIEKWEQKMQRLKYNTHTHIHVYIQYMGIPKTQNV